MSDSFDRVLAENVYSKIDVPSFDRSTVDGYAVKATDIGVATETIPAFLKIAGEVMMGASTDYTLKSGECMYVPTGGMIPSGADSCVMIEHTEKFSTDKLAVYESVAEGKNIIKKGDDIKEGNLILSKGKIIKVADMGFLSSAGVKKIKVYKK